MAVKIRLARGGSKKRPFYRVVVADVRAPRDGKFIEKLGTFNPLLSSDNSERIIVNKERVEYWINTGAKPTERVAKLITKLGIKVPGYVEKTAANTKENKKVIEAAAKKAEKASEEEAA